MKDNIFEVIFRGEEWFYIQTKLTKTEAEAILNLWITSDTIQGFQTWCDEKDLPIKIINIEEIFI